MLNGTQITNESLVTIAELKTLERLYLGDTPIDDAAVPTLKQMEQLQLLFLSGTQITAGAVAELQTVFLESCTIIHQSGTFQGTRKSPLAMARRMRRPLTPSRSRITEESLMRPSSRYFFSRS